MTAVTVPRSARTRRKSLLGSVIDAVSRSRRHRRLIAAVADKVRDNVVTVAAFASLDFGIWQASHVAAFCVAAPLLLILEWKVRGE